MTQTKQNEPFTNNTFINQAQNENNAQTSNTVLAKQKPRHLGHFTMGIALITSGIVLLLAMVFPTLNLWEIIKYAPIFLVLLGIEVLYDCAKHKTDTSRVIDVFSVFMCTIVIGGATVLALLYTAMQLNFWY